MSDKKISQLTGSTTPLAGTEVLPIVQSGSTVKVTVANLTAGRSISASAVGANVTSPAVQLHAQGSNANLGTLELDSDPSVDFVGLTMWTKKTVPNANSRNWHVAANYQGFGTFDIMSSTTPTDAPTVSRFSMDNAGNATLNTGNLAIGTAGKGIDFSADGQAAGMTSELLDDYEEGTFTPTVTSGSGTITSFTLGDCFYTKIGRVVTINFAVTITDAGTGAGNLNVSLPFTNGASAGNGTGRENALTGNQLQTRVSPSSAEMNIQTYNNLSTIATNAAILATLTYFV